eukprot:jgi/Astpho2/9196/Aster-07155
MHPGLQAVQQRGNSALTTSGSNNAMAVTKALLVDTLDMMRKFERLGMSRDQAESLTRSMTEIMCVNKEKIAEQFVSKASLEKLMSSPTPLSQAVLEQEARIAGFKSEVQKSQELHHSSLTRDTERLQTMLDKVKAEIRYEIDKLTASQRLDLNLEKGRMRDELQALRDKANELEIKMDKETNSLKAAVEQTKNETIKYCLGMMLAFTTAGLGAARLVSK